MKKFEKKEINLKYGTIYVQKNEKNNYNILDSQLCVLFWQLTTNQVKEKVSEMKKYNSVGEWIVGEEYEDVCWGDSYKYIRDFTKSYQEDNDRDFDESWFEDNYNLIGNTFIMFEYSEAYFEADCDEED